MTGLLSRARKQTRRISLVVLTRGIDLFVRMLPYRVAIAAGAFLGWIAYYAIPRERKRATVHLSSVFPERDASWIARTGRRCFIHLGRSLVEALAMDRTRLSSVVEFPEQEKIAKALAQGRGAIYVTGHIGNWELMADAVAARFPLGVIAAPLEPQAVNDMIVGLRNRMGIKTIVRGKQGSVKELLRSFKENRILGLLIDQDTDVEGAFVDFMGRPAWTPTAAAQMAIKFDAPVIFGYIHRESAMKHRLTIEGPLELIRTGNTAKDILLNTAMLTKKIEEAVLRHPEQWVWMHRRWRRQP